MPREKIFQVSEFNDFINIYLDKVGEVVVEGEIAECRVNQNRWLFLTIKDDSSSVEVFGVTFQISGYSVLEPGMLVRVYGTPRLYQKTGRFSIYANQIVPAGEGALKLANEKLKEKLRNEGLFDTQRKRKICDFPQQIGLITAKNSMAYGDFITILQQRMGGIKIYFYPVSVQGKECVKCVSEAFIYFNENYPELDALVLVRGGGSLEDLQPFNDELMARAIFSSKIPVVCGVGHEDDLTIADEVSDLRASTPTNAAELLVKTRTETLAQVLHDTKIISNHLFNLLIDNNHKIRRSVSLLENVIVQQTYYIRRSVTKFLNEFTILKEQTRNLEHTRQGCQSRLFKSSDRWIYLQKDKLIRLYKFLSSFDTQRVLSRGFSITFDSEGKVIKSANQVKAGSQITSNLFDGKIDSQVLNLVKE